MEKQIPQHANEAKPQVDPTRNVLDLVEAAVHRTDDLRNAEKQRHDELRAADNRRIDDLRVAQGLRLDGESRLHAHYQGLLSVAEAKRIDAIRAVDVNAVAVANERQAAQAIVLANQVAASADALRLLVASTAATTNAAQTAMVQQFNDRIGTLEKSSYVGQGRQTLSDPAMADLASEMKRMVVSQSQSTGKAEGLSTAWAVLIGIGALAAALFGSGFLNRAPTAPTVVYVPAEVAAPTTAKPKVTP